MESESNLESRIKVSSLSRTDYKQLIDAILSFSSIVLMSIYSYIGYKKLFETNIHFFAKLAGAAAVLVSLQAFSSVLDVMFFNVQPFRKGGRVRRIFTVIGYIACYAIITSAAYLCFYKHTTNPAVVPYALCITLFVKQMLDIFNEKYRRQACSPEITAVASTLIILSTFCYSMQYQLLSCLFMLAAHILVALVDITSLIGNSMTPVVVNSKMLRFLGFANLVLTTAFFFLADNLGPMYKEIVGSVESMLPSVSNK